MSLRIKHLYHSFSYRHSVSVRLCYIMDMVMPIMLEMQIGNIYFLPRTRIIFIKKLYYKRLVVNASNEHGQNLHLWYKYLISFL